MIVFRTLICICILIFLSPIILLISILIKIESKGPIFHTSTRVGQNGELFNLYKFRSMRINTPQIATHLMFKKKKLYLTRVGKYLRKYSLDEIPQIFNILKNEMNFIGPRPALFNQYDLINLRKNKNIDRMKPGITGFAQVNGRDSISIKKKVDYEYYYFINKSLILDIKIIIKTIYKVLFGADVKF